MPKKCIFLMAICLIFCNALPAVELQDDFVGSRRLEDAGITVKDESGDVTSQSEPLIRTVQLLSEDFEELPLGPNVDETLPGDAVWTKTAPEGWVIDDSGVPGVGDSSNDGVTEWAGWSFTKKDWWVSVAGDQERSQFSKGIGTVAVADPDEWDDLPHAPSAENGWYDTYLSTPPVSLVGILPDSVVLTFDSSWRHEYDNNYHQTAEIRVAFDGGQAQQIMLWESNPNSNHFKADNTNETVSLDLHNPAGAKSMVITFGLFDAGNDWWWAIDNIDISGTSVPGTAYVFVRQSDGTTKVTEGGAADTYELVLYSQPTADVTITATPADNQIDIGAGAGNPVTVVFTPDNWNVAQIMRVTAVDDNVYEGKYPMETVISHQAQSDDDNYDDITIDTVTVKVIDNDKTCGDWGYFRTDLNRDCYVNLLDFAILAQDWLKSPE